MKSLATITFLIFVNPAFSQGDCSQAVINAERAYYAGRFEEVRVILSPCIGNGFDKEHLAAAYRLVALCGIFSHNFELADSAMLQMYRVNPRYTFTAADPPEFRVRAKRVKAFPRFTVSLGGGLYVPDLRVSKVYNLRSLSSNVKYSSSLGYRYSFGVIYSLGHRVSVEGSYEWQSIKFSIKDRAYNDDRSFYSETRMDEKELRTQFSMAVGYGMKWKNLRLCVAGGIGYNRLVKAESDLFHVEALANSNVETAIYRERLGFSNLGSRTRTDVRPIIQTRISIPLKKCLIDIFARYEFGTFSFTTDRYANESTIVLMDWVEDDFRANFFSFGILIGKPWYHVSY